MSHIVFCSPSGSTIFFEIILKNGKILEKSYRICVSIFSTVLYEPLFTLRTERDVIKMYISLLVKCPLFLTYFNWTGIFSTVLKYQISWKSIQWEPSCSMRTDRHDKANSRSSKFCKRTYNTTAICKLLLKFNATWSLSFPQCSILPWSLWKLRWPAFSKFLPSIHLWATFRIFFCSKSFVVDKRINWRNWRLSQSQSHVTIDRLSVCLSVCVSSPIWSPWSNFGLCVKYYCLSIYARARLPDLD
jgi:hypothetical protein